MKRSLSLALGACALALAPVHAASADEYPQEPISIVVGFSPGGTDDTGARALAPYLSEELGVPVVVDGRPGAAMQVALEHVWAQPHDGHTLLWNNQQYLSTIEASEPDVPYRTDQWVYLEVLQSDPTVIVVRSDSPWQSLPDLIEDMHERPNEITLGLLTGSAQLLACKRLFEGIVEASFREVPQQGGGSMRSSLVGGHLDAICTNSSETYNLGDDVRALAVFGDRRSELLPDAEPVNEVLADLGHDERIPDLGSVRGIAVPKPFVDENPEAFERLHEAYRAAVSAQDYLDWLEETGRDAVTQSMSLEDSNAMIAEYNEFFSEHRDLFLGE